jgi:hypothetical protein
MPNLYATPGEIKMAIPDGIRSSTTRLDGLLTQLSERASRAIDRYCRRVFAPRLEARLFQGQRVNPADELWVDDLVEIDTIEISDDGGATYDTLASGDWYATVGDDANGRSSWTMIRLDGNGDYSSWPSSQKAVKITGWWAYADERAAAWEDSAIDLASGYTSGGASLTVADLSVLDVFGVSSALEAGRLVRIDDEMFEVVSVAATTSGSDTLGVVGARNGSAAANHLQNASIYLWRPPEPVKQATIIQAVRSLERGYQGFGDARSADMGQVMYMAGLDPEAQQLLSAYRRLAVG